MHALGSVDELPSKSYPVPRPAHTAFKQIPHPQLMPHLLRVDIAAPVGEAGIRAITNRFEKRDNAVMISSTMPSAK